MIHICNIFGGIVGQISSANKSIKACKNSGIIDAKDAYDVGGIAGNVYRKMRIEECINESQIEGITYIGGIIGGGIVEIKDCINKGEIIAKNNYVGGITGFTRNSSNLECCYNSGQVIGKGEYTGGIVGIIDTDGNDTSELEPPVVSKCYNSGSIQGVKRTGGIIGGACQYNSLIEKCYNLGEVYGTETSTGGIAGTLGRSSKIYNCYNMNKVIGTERVGGIVGYTYKSAGEIKNCYNIGNINGTSEVGGILGKNNNSSTITNSYYLAGTATLDEGSDSANNLAKSKEYITQDFVTTANSEETIWKFEAGKNDGWPILNE